MQPQSYVKDLLKEFSGVFWADLLGRLPVECVITHGIELRPSTKPLSKSPYRLNANETQEVEKQLVDYVSPWIYQAWCFSLGFTNSVGEDGWIYAHVRGLEGVECNHRENQVLLSLVGELFNQHKDEIS